MMIRSAPDGFMTNTTSKWRRIVQISLISAGLLILVGISASSIYLAYSLRDDADAITHTLEVENQISLLLLQMRRAESAERGFLLTQKPEFMAEFSTAEAAIRPTYDRLKQLTADNPVQVRHLTDVLPLIEKQLRDFNVAIGLARSGQQPEALKIVSDNAVQQTTTAIREIAASMRAEEERLLAQRSVAANRNQLLSAAATTTGSLAVLGLAGIALLLVRRSWQVRDEAERQLKDSNANLETAVEERTADLSEANEEIQRFAYIVSHDLRSPLVNIMGFTSELEELREGIFNRIAELAAHADTLETTAPPTAPPPLEGNDKQLAEEFDEAITFIKSSIGKMDRLINAILHLTREARRAFKPERVDVGKLIEGITQTVAHQVDEANAEIKVEPLPDIVSDRLALEQIFSNLIDNALKYLQPGIAGSIQIKGRRKTSYIIYDVVDNGRGIDPKDHQRIFDLFRRAGTQDRPGQGIGLAHVRALVRRMGGTLSVSSEPGKGSTFTVMLPSKWKLDSKEMSA
jgi:signal transduction histidine kinase